MGFNFYTPIKLKPNLMVSMTLVFLTSFIDILAGSLVVPVLRDYTLHFGATEFEHGVIFVAYPFAQTFSAIIMGYLSDKFGRKPLLIWSLIGSSFGHLFQALCEDKWMFFIARFVTGCLGGSVTVSLAYISDSVKSEDRPKWQGRLYSATSVSWIFGPVISTAVLGVHLKFPLYIAAVGSFIILVASILFMSDSNDLIEVTRGRDEAQNNKQSSDNGRDRNIPESDINRNPDDIVKKNENKNSEYDQIDKKTIDTDVVVVGGEIDNKSTNSDNDVHEQTMSPEITLDKQSTANKDDIVEVVTHTDPKGDDHIVEPWDDPYVKKYFMMILIFVILTSFCNWSTLTALDLLFPMYAKDVVPMSSLIVGVVFSLQSLIFIAKLLFFVPLLHRYISYSYFWLIYTPLSVIFLGLMVVFFDSGVAISLLEVVVSFSVAPLINVATLTISLIVPEEKQGYYLSYSNTAESVSKIFVPLLYTYLYGIKHIYPFYAMLGIGGLMMVVGYILFFFVNPVKIYGKIPHVSKSNNGKSVVPP